MHFIASAASINLVLEFSMLLFSNFFTQLLVLIYSKWWQILPVANTNCGKIQGFNALSSNGTSYSAFLNIPFAIPPVGDLRFTYPQPFGKWSGTRNGYQSGNSCPQLVMNSLTGDENCLNLNVYVPQFQTNIINGTLPVMVYFFPGEFNSGSNAYDLPLGPEKFMDFPVVLVVPNYRLGAFGFLSTNDSSAYGNYALLDAVLALQWVRDNIQAFGGDPSKVTIFGDSAGSVIVVNLVLSQLSKGLFSRAIDESGSAFMPWAVTPNPLENAQKLAEMVNCPIENSEELVNCLRNKTSLEIVIAASCFPGASFAPVVEAPGGPGFLTEMPVDVILDNKIGNNVSMIISSAQLEGYPFFELMVRSLSNYNGTGNDYFRSEFISLLPYFTGVQPNMTEAVDAIENYYDLRNLDLINKTTFVLVYSTIIGDTLFEAWNSETANLLSQAGLPVHASIYAHVGALCFALLLGGQCGLYSSHADEVLIEFSIFGLHSLTNSDQQMTKELNALYVTFAYHGDLYLSPGVLWPLYNTTNPQYAILNVPPTISSGMLSNATQFWTVTIPDLVNKYNKAT